MSRRPRLLYVVTTPASLLFVRGQVAAMTRAGIDVSVATNCSASAAPIVDGVAVEHLPLERQPAPITDLVALWRTVRLLRRLRPDAVHAGTPKAGLIGMLGSWIARVPLRVYAVHGLRYETTRGGARRLFVLLERLTAAAATHVVPDSPSLAGVLRRDRIVPDRKISIIGPGSSNGVDTDRFIPDPSPDTARRALGLRTDAVVVGFVGRLTHDKGVDDLVRWFRSRAHSSTPVQLLVVGREEDGDPIDATTRAALSTDPDIVRIDWMDDPRTAYASMDVLAFPSYREGLPNVPLEAQSMGVPVVGYAATGTVDAVPDRAALVPVGDVDALAERLSRLLDRPAERRRLGDEAADWVRATFDRRVVWGHKVDFVSEALRRAGRAAPAAAPR